MEKSPNLTHKLTAEELRRGGKNSGKTRRNKKLLRDCVDALLEGKERDENGHSLTGAERLAINLFTKALSEQDTAKAAKAFEVLRDTAGQKPVDRVVHAEIDPAVMEEIERMIEEEDE